MRYFLVALILFFDRRGMLLKRFSYEFSTGKAINSVLSMTESTSKTVTNWNNELTALEKHIEERFEDLERRTSDLEASTAELTASTAELTASTTELEARTARLQESFARLIDDERYVQTHIILQDLNIFFRIEDVYLSTNQTVIAESLRMLNNCQIGGWHYLYALPRKKAVAISAYKPLRRYDDTQADLCRKFQVLRAFLSSPAMTDKIINKIGRDVFFAIKSHFEAQTAGDALAPAKTLTAQQLAIVDHEIRHCLRPFPEFTF